MCTDNAAFALFGRAWMKAILLTKDLPLPIGCFEEVWRCLLVTIQVALLVLLSGAAPARKITEGAR